MSTVAPTPSAGSTVTPLGGVGVPAITPVPAPGSPPQYIQQTTKSAQAIKESAAANRAARAEAAIGTVIGTPEGSEGKATIQTVAGPVERAEPVETEEATPEAAAAETAEAAAPEQEGELVGEQAEAEKSRAERIEQAVKKAKSSAAANRRMQARLAQQDQMLVAERQRTQQFAQQAQRAQQIGRPIEGSDTEAKEIGHCRLLQ